MTYGRSAFLWPLLPGVLGLAVAACDEVPRQRYRLPEDAGFVAFVGAGENDPLWPILRAGAQRFDRHLGRYHVKYAAPVTPTPERQVELIRSMIGPRMRALCVHLLDREVAGPLFTEVRKNGGIVVTMVTETESDLVTGHCGYDEAEIGAALADATVRYLNDAGAVMVLYRAEGTAAQAARYKAFKEQIRFSHVERWAELDCGGDAARARAIIRERSARYPRLGAWVSMEPWPFQAWGTESGLPDGCRVITCGAGPTVWPRVASGACVAAVGSNYYDLGYMALQFAQNEIESPSPYPRRYTVPIRMVYPSNLDAYKKDWAFWATQQDVPEDDSGLGVETAE
jgi:ABC-type sugar transport system substrate-binding protein